MTSHSPEQEELVYAAAVVILSNELYPRKLEVVREYIQNASDAIDSFARIADILGDTSAPQIKISIQGRSLLLWDNGIGMDAEEIAKLRRIAYSEKRQGEEAGYKGIGRLAGIAVASKLLISSTSYGDPKLHKFEFRAREFQDDISTKKREGLQEAATLVINRHTTISHFDVDPEEHYTLVELRDIDEAYAELLDPARLRDFIGEIAPVDFAPEFKHAHRISTNLFKNVPDYSPKAVWLTTAAGERIQVYKPYIDSMMLSDPEFIDIVDPDDGRMIAYCWCTTRGKEMLGGIRPAGNKFVVPGGSPEERKRLAGLVYKLFGFSIGDRNLPLRTLWKKDYTRPLWFTGEIHIVDKKIKPTTDRSDFIDNEPRRRLYSAGEKRVAKYLNALAQTISNNRQAHDVAFKWQGRFDELQRRLDNYEIERAEVKTRKEELNGALERDLGRDCRDKEIQAFLRQVAHRGRTLLNRLDEAKSKKDSGSEISDLARELNMTSSARKVYMIIMGALEIYYRNDRDTYYDLSSNIKQALKKKY
jgi:Histidine kinase-, DNA gyrase B-, and HSP90-like ATPase